MKLSRFAITFSTMVLSAVAVDAGCGDSSGDDADAASGGSAGTGAGGAGEGSAGTRALAGGAGGTGATGGTSLAGTGGGAGSGGSSAGAAGTAGGGAAGASAGEAGKAGAGRDFSTDPSTFGGAPRCPSAGVKLCDDFEPGAVGDAPDKAVWEVQTWGQGTATIDDAHAMRGKHSVHIHEPPAISRVVLRETKTFPAPQNTFYGRFFLWLDKVPEPLQCGNGNCTNLVHWTAAAASGPYSYGGKMYTPEVRAVGAVNTGFLVNLDGGPDPEVGISDDKPPAGQAAPVAGKWTCFEFEYKGQGADAEVRVWWDGVEHPALHYSSSNVGDAGKLWAIPEYANFDIGLAHYQDYTKYFSAFDVWVDEVAVDYQRIGCDL